MCQVVYFFMLEMLNNNKILGFHSHFPRKTISIDKSTKKRLVKISRTPLLNIDTQQLKNLICEYIHKK